MMAGAFRTSAARRLPTLNPKGDGYGPTNGRFVVLNVREKSIGFGTVYIWNRKLPHFQRLDVDCSIRTLAAQSLTRDGDKIVLCCDKDLGNVIRVRDLATGQEFPIEDSDFGVTKGIPRIRGEGIAISPDGKYLATTLIEQSEALVVTPIPGLAGDISRSDLRIWCLEKDGKSVTLPIDDLVSYSSHYQGIDLPFSPDSTMLAVGGRQLRIYRVPYLFPPP